MRNITTNATAHFIAGTNFKSSNTTVEIKEINGEKIVQLRLFGHLIAERNNTGTFITNAGYKTVTTKERLNGLPGVSICQKNGIWYLNGMKWNGEKIYLQSIPTFS